MCGVGDGNVKLGCDDGCTTINIIKFTELKNRKIFPFYNKKLYVKFKNIRELSIHIFFHMN